MTVFEKSKWIWTSHGEGVDRYAEFRDKFVFGGSKAIMNLSCDTDYTLFVNGKFAASNQYGDFEHYKIYDELDITQYLNIGENSVDILVYYCGVDNSRYRRAKAGLIYEIISENKILAYSNEKTQSRTSPAYVSGKCLPISPQLGFTFEYDATKASDSGYDYSVCVSKNCAFFPRPVRKAVLLSKHPVKSVVRHGDAHFLIDLGREVVGIPTLELFSETEQKITVAWGEHIEDGCVRKTIGNRHFYYEYKTHIGKNEFTNYMLRLGARYIEVFSENAIEIDYVGIIPQIIEVEENPYRFDNVLDEQIYTACLDTLKACMMEHYVDCPWREQALYAFDSRNQMLCGYYAFKNGNAEYARANLQLFGEDQRDDGLLSICCPCGIPLAIPSFSLYYIVSMEEYVRHTKDVELALKYSRKMKAILDEFVFNLHGDLICTFTGDQMWNFYDWSDFSQGSLGQSEPPHPDLIINCLFIIALDCFEYICSSTGIDFPYPGLADKVRSKVNEVFYTDKQCFTMNVGKEQYTALGNSLAILAKIVKEQEASDICENLVSGELSDCSLSMKIFVYRALMDTDIYKYRDYILSDIRSNYKKMLDSGHNTVWETLKGASDFDGAGSLCHGWSAIPVYIYHRLGMVK